MRIAFLALIGAVVVTAAFVMAVVFLLVAVKMLETM